MCERERNQSESDQHAKFLGGKKSEYTNETREWSFEFALAINRTQKQRTHTSHTHTHTHTHKVEDIETAGSFHV